MLVTVMVSAGVKSYTAQHRCHDWDQFVGTLLTSVGFREFCESALAIPNTRPLTADEVFVFMPMKPLVETWVHRVAATERTSRRSV